MSRAGAILRVDLTSGEVRRQPTAEYVPDYIGGAAIASKIICDEVPPEATALDPRNFLTFNAGPLTGTLLGNKCEVVSRAPEMFNSPIACSGLGGQFPSEMKFAGYDHIVLAGRAARPTYLFVNDGEVELRDAAHLRGLDTAATQVRIKEELRDPDVQIACIGQAGENLNAYALILHDIQNTAGKGGLGAVMGSKNLKAVAVRGSKGVRVADPEEFLSLWKDNWEYYTKGDGALWAKLFHREGWARQIADFGKHLDVYPWGYYDTYVSPPLSRETEMGEFLKRYKVRSIGCAFCPVQCQQNYSVPGVGDGGATCIMYESYRFLIKSDDTKLWWKASREANLYGIDIIDISNITGWLMLLYEKGIISASDTDGVPMEWGSEKAVMTVLEKICRKEGFGALFANGLVPAAKRIAGGKGLEYVQHERNRLPSPSSAPMETTIASVGGLLLWRASPAYVWTSPPHVDFHGTYPWMAEELGISKEDAREMLERWCDEQSEKYAGHKSAWRPDPGTVEGKAALLKMIEGDLSACDITGHCDYQTERLPHMHTRGGLNRIAAWLTAATGTKYTAEKLLEVIHRRRLLELSYYLLCEQAVGEEIVPCERFHWFVPRPDGHFKGKYWASDLEGSLQVGLDYSNLWGCDPDTGLPLSSELERLGLKDVAERLRSALGVTLK
ncbi:MAG: aldehyde ferredoxin oxidoreductase N-terminal domain-containing protein [bacterium]